MVKNKSKIRQKAKDDYKLKLSNIKSKNNPFNNMFGGQKFIDDYNKALDDEVKLLLIKKR